MRTPHVVSVCRPLVSIQPPALSSLWGFPSLWVCSLSCHCFVSNDVLHTQCTCVLQSRCSGGDFSCSGGTSVTNLALVVPEILDLFWVRSADPNLAADLGPPTVGGHRLRPQFWSGKRPPNWDRYVRPGLPWFLLCIQRRLVSICVIIECWHSSFRSSAYHRQGRTQDIGTCAELRQTVDTRSRQH